MAYSKQSWTNGVSEANATTLGHIEDGIEAAAATADAAETPAGAQSKVDTLETSLSATYATANTRTATGLAEPWTLAHRGLANLVPENTMESLRAAYAVGAAVFELDVHAIADGSLVVMHDATVDRATTSTGNVRDHSAASWAALDVDGAMLGGAYATKLLRAPFLKDVLNEFGGKVVLVLEAKHLAAIGAMQAFLEANYPHLKPSVVLAEYVNYSPTEAFAELSAAAASGWTTAGYADDTSVPAADFTAGGLTYAAVTGGGLTTAYVAALIGEGLKVWANPVTEDREARQSWLDVGCAGIISDDYLYNSGGTEHRLSSDPFDLNTWYHGQLAGVAGRRGSFDAGRLRLGFSTTNDGTTSVLQGWASPLATPTDFTLSFNYKLEQEDSNTAQWAGVALMVSDSPFDPFVTDAADDGYHIIFRQNGTIQIYRYTDGASSMLAQSASTPLTAGTSFDVTITVTPTDITVTRVDTAASAVAADATHRGAFLHLTNVNTSGHRASFADMAVS